MEHCNPAWRRTKSVHADFAVLRGLTIRASSSIVSIARDSRPIDILRSDTPICPPAMATDPLALVRTISSTAKIASAMRNAWDARTKISATLHEGSALELVIRAQIDEVLLVLAHLGEALLPLGIFNKDYYLQTLGEVQASIASCGNELLPMAWAELDAELQYVCTAGFTICACYAPFPVYRGFGACVLGDWDWACPDMAYLEEKARRKAIRTVYGFKQKVDAQPARSAFTAFDSAIQILQVKSMAFLTKRPLISGFAEQQPRFGGKPKKEVKDDLEWLEDWVKQLDKRGHPVPRGTRLTSWGVPFATWTSPYGCHILQSQKDCETIVCIQMDPGRLLHAFICRGNTNLDEGQILWLLPRSPAESLMCWLEGLPGTSHKIIKWHDLDKEYFEKKIGKSLRKKIGQYPLPTQFAVRDPEAATRPSLPLSTSSPSVLEHPNTVSPPPYSPSKADPIDQPAPPTAELGSPDPRELPAAPTRSPARSPQQSRSLPVPGSSTSTALKNIHTLRRKPTAPGLTANSTATAISQSAEQPLVGSSNGPAERFVHPTVAAELPEDTAQIAYAASETPNAVELPTETHSKAPKPLAPDNPRETSQSLSATSSGPVEQAGALVVSQVSEAPGDIPRTESPENTEIKPPEQVPKTSNGEKEQGSQNSITHENATSGNQYLDLLNRVAKGEISPQALSEMLQKGDLQSSSPLTAGSVTTKNRSTESMR